MALIPGARSRSLDREQLARDAGVPGAVLDHVANCMVADFEHLCANDGDNADGRAILQEAARTLFAHRSQGDDALVERYLRQLPQHDYEALRLFKAGKTHSDIAALMHTDVETVRWSLAQTYAGVRECLLEQRRGNQS